MITNWFLSWNGLNVLRCMNFIIFIIQFVSRFSFFAPSGPGHLLYWGFTITLRYTTLGRSPLDEWSVRRRCCFQTTHNTHTGYPCPRGDWNPQSHEGSGPWHTPYTPRLSGAAIGRLNRDVSELQFKYIGLTVESTSHEKYNLGEWRSIVHIYIYIHTGLFQMIVGVLTTCHTKYTWGRSIQGVSRL